MDNHIDITPPRHFSVISVIALLMCAFAWSAIYARVADRNARIDKDIVYLYLCGIEMSDPALHDQQTELVKQLDAVSAPDFLIYRAKMRGAYCNNYPFTSLSMFAAGKIQQNLGLADPAKDFPVFLLNSIRWGMGFSGALLGISCLLVVFWSIRNNAALTLATYTAVAAAALLYLYLPAPFLSWILHSLPLGKEVTLQRITGLELHAWLNPTAAFSPFSIFPRCLTAMLAFAAFSLRWSGRNASAYWVPLVVCFVHQSAAPILLGVMICCDLAVQPLVLRRRAIYVPILLTVATIALRERMFSTLGFSWGLALVAVVFVAGFAALMILFPPAPVRSLWLRLNSWRTKFQERFPRPFAETMVVLSLWWAVLVICFLFRNDTLYRVIYFWSELPSRYVGLFQLSVFIGLTYPAWLAIVRRRPRAIEVAVAAISCVMLFVGIIQWRQPWEPMTALASQGRQFEETVAKGYAGDLGSYSRVETPFYYLLVRQALLGGEGIAEYFGKSQLPANPGQK